MINTRGIRALFSALMILAVGGCQSVKNSNEAKSYTAEQEMTFQSSQTLNGSVEVTYSLLAFEPDQLHKKFPMVLAFHGGGGSGSQYLEFLKKEAEVRRIMILAPTDRIINVSIFHQLLEQILKRYPVDKDKIFVMGTSSGGLTARWLFLKYPGIWKGAVLVSAPADDLWGAGNAAGHLPPVLFLHGKNDKQFSFQSVEKNTQFLRQKGVSAEVLVDFDAGHEHKSEWNKQIFDWIDAHSK